MNLIPTLIASISLSFLLLSLPLPSLSAKCNPQDKKVLKKIEKQLTIPPHFQSWKPDIDCCDWDGVYCDSDTNRVTYLTIQKNSVIAGRIPDAIGDLPALTDLAFLNCPNLTGPLPKSLTKLTNLTRLSIFDTNLSGPVPSFFSQIKNLNLIRLAMNNFSGPIPASLSQLPNLLYLDLEGNKLTGEVPRSFGDTNLLDIDFSNNKLEGDLSFFFGKNKRTLQFADFANNRFEFDLSKVEFQDSLLFLYLNNNKIYGSIPVEMTKLNLLNFNVSYNRLCGKIPTGGKLQSFDLTAYFHNRCLCGAPLPPCK